MRTVGRALRLGLLAGVLLLAAQASRADVIRLERGDQVFSKTEEQWEPTTQTQTIAYPWFHERARRYTETTSRNGPRLRELQEDQFRRYVCTYPQEAQSVRVCATRVRTYDLREFAVVPVERWLPATASREVGEWLPTIFQVPATLSVTLCATRDEIATLSMPVQHLLSATYSVPGDPLLRTITYDEPATYSVSVSKPTTTTILIPRTVTEYYDGPVTLSDNPRPGHLRVYRGDTGELEGDLSESTPNSLNWVAHAESHFVFPPNPDSQFTPTYAYGRSTAPTILRGNGTILRVYAHDELFFDGDPHSVLGHWAYWGKRRHAILEGPLIATHTLSDLVTIPSTETRMETVTTTHPATFSLQVERMFQVPAEAPSGTPGVRWCHYHRPQDPCPLKSWSVLSSDPLLGSVYRRLGSVTLPQRSAFKLVAHRTADFPLFEDELGPSRTKTGTYSITTYVPRAGTVTVKEWVTMVKPVMRLVGWDVASGSFAHDHGDPSVICALEHVASASESIVTHDAWPRFEPVTVPKRTIVWATRSIEVTVLAPHMSTASVLIRSTPRVEVTTSATPWSATGKLRNGNPTVETATYSALTVLSERCLAATSPETAPVGRGRAVSFTSDFQGGTGRQTLTGSRLRIQLKGDSAIAAPVRTHGSRPGAGILAPTTLAGSAGPPASSRAGVAH